MNALTGIGTKLNQMDTAIASGLSPAEAARQISPQSNPAEEEVSRIAVQRKIWRMGEAAFPSLFSVMIRKMKVR